MNRTGQNNFAGIHLKLGHDGFISAYKEEGPHR